MIKLADNVVFLTDQNGQPEPVSLTAIEEDLRHASDTKGYDHDELIREILILVKNYIVCRESEHEIITLSAIETLIATVLREAGLNDVAEFFCEQRNVLISDTDNRPTTPDSRTILQILSTDPYFQNKPVEELTGLVHDKVNLLGLSRTTKILVLALARNIWLDKAMSITSPKAAGTESADDQQVINKEDIAAICAPRYSELIDKNIIDIGPISLLLPSINIRVYMNNLANVDNPSALLEIHLFPVFNLLCEQIHDIIDALKKEVVATTSLVKEIDVNVTLLFSGPKSASKAASFPSRKTIRNLQPELTNIVNHHMRATDFFHIAFEKV